MVSSENKKQQLKHRAPTITRLQKLARFLGAIVKLKLSRDIKDQQLEDKGYSMSRRTVLRCYKHWTFRGNSYCQLIHMYAKPIKKSVYSGPELVSCTRSGA